MPETPRAPGAALSFERHAPVLAQEAVDALAILGDGIYVDATFGRGGHARLILDRLGENGRLVAVDRDPQAILACREIQDPRLVCIHARFSSLREALVEKGISRIDGMLFDLGVSSPQLDDPQRGFSFLGPGPLDMRMNPQDGAPLGDRLSCLKEEEIADILFRLGEERLSRKIARALYGALRKGEIKTTLDLAQVVARANPRRERGKHPATRAFLAFRLWMNEEPQELQKGLEAAESLLPSGGRLAVIAFHSGEDRMVKHFLRSRLQSFETLGKTKPSPEELLANPRARSAIMRLARRR